MQLKGKTDEPREIVYTAHECEITINGNEITVRDGMEEIKGTADDPEWNIRTFILGQIHGILAEYSPSQLISAVKESLRKE